MVPAGRGGTTIRIPAGDLPAPGFFNQTSRTTHERAFEYPLTLLSDVRLSGRGSKRRLELRVGTLGHAVQVPCASSSIG